MTRYAAPLNSHPVSVAQREAAAADGFVVLDEVQGWGGGLPADATLVRLLPPSRVDVVALLNASNWARALLRSRPTVAVEFDLRSTDLASYGVARAGVVAELTRPAARLDRVRGLLRADAATARSLWRRVESPRI